jgi:ABC-2 type transport system ATP-binding protein
MGDGFANETHRLSKRYGDQIVAVDDLDPWVRRSEAYAFLGPNGVGKPTRLRMLLGLVRPTPGTASVLGARAGSAIKAVDVRGKVVLAVG